MTTLPSTFTKPLSLAKLTQNETQARNALAQRACRLPFSWGGAWWQLTMTPMAQTGPLQSHAGEWRARMEWASATFEIAMPAVAARTWLTARFPSLVIDNLPDTFATAALESACEELLSHLSKQQSGPACLLALAREPGAATADLSHLFFLEARCGEEVISARLACGSLGLMLMAGLASGLPPVRNELPTGDLPFRLRAELGYTWLTSTELRGLLVGDAVLMEHVFLTPQGDFWFGSDTWGVRVLHSDTALTVTKTFTQLDITMPSTSTDPKDLSASTDGAIFMDDDVADAQPVGIEQLPLRMTFDLGERRMTLDALQNLQKGQSIDLARPLSAAVNLRVNGALVGTGELIEIDGRIGVTITALAKAG